MIKKVKLSNAKKNQKYFNMKARCSKQYQEEHPKYKGVYMSDEWKHNKKETFFKFLDDEWYEVDNEQMDIDKDILVYGNKQYCKENVLIVPHKINVLYEDFELGKTNIKYNDKNNTYCVRVSDRGFTIKVDDITGRNNAIDIYCNIKYMILLELAEQYKDKITDKLYNAMINTDLKAINSKYYDELVA